MLSLWLWFFLGLAAPRALAQTDGIYADFDTSLGGFTCRLEYARTPRTVANFIGLATGARPWIEVATGRVRAHPFYDGQSFHRVIPSFMIQGGSPNGQGTDGSGYVFPDEFDPALRHDGPGVLSMANSGPASNGAQFFVTVAATAWLDDVHTVFGRVAAGQSVVDAISQVARDSADKPLTNVVLNRITIRRVGAAAEAFDIHAHNLPAISTVPLGITTSTNGVRLSLPAVANAEHFLAFSSNLTSWTANSLGIDLVPPATNTLERTSAETAQYYSLSRAQYPGSTFAPRTMSSRTLRLVFDGGLGTIEVAFNGAEGGTYEYSGSAGTVSRYQWTQEAYRGRLWPIEFSALVPMALRLDFTNDAGGTLAGTAYTAIPVSVSGGFTLSAPSP